MALTRGPHNTADAAYEFYGNANSYIEFPNSRWILDVGQSITLLCWVRPGGKDGPLFNYNKSGPYGVHLWITSGKLYFRITKVRSHARLPAITTDQRLGVGKWAHVAATYNHTTGVNSIYVNGMLNKTQNIGAGLRISTNDRAIRMGATISNGRYFKGAVTQMGVYNVALSARQIRAVMSKGNIINL